MKVKQKCIGDYVQKVFLILVLSLIPILGTGIVFADSEDINIEITPSTLNLKVEEPYLTVYAEIPYSTVNLNSLTLERDDETVANSTHVEADACGNLVVKFNRTQVAGMDDVNEIIILTLKGETIDQTVFEGSDEIRVISNGL
jgi:hypothetical protein